MSGQSSTVLAMACVAHASLVAPGEEHAVGPMWTSGAALCQVVVLGSSCEYVSAHCCWRPWPTHAGGGQHEPCWNASPCWGMAAMPSTFFSAHCTCIIPRKLAARSLQRVPFHTASYQDPVGCASAGACGPPQPGPSCAPVCRPPPPPPASLPRPPASPPAPAATASPAAAPPRPSPPPSASPMTSTSQPCFLPRPCTTRWV